jgi:hypothetical protein
MLQSAPGGLKHPAHGCSTVAVVVTFGRFDNPVTAARRIAEEGKRVQKSTVGGILSIVAGALGVVGGLLLLVMTLFASTIFNDQTFFSGTTTADEQFLTLITVIYGALAVFYLIVGALGIVGGIFSIQRKRWGWALAGAIAGCLSFLPLGVGAVVLVAMGHSEFNQNAPGVPAQPPVNNPA